MCSGRSHIHLGNVELSTLIRFIFMFLETIKMNIRRGRGLYIFESVCGRLLLVHCINSINEVPRPSYPSVCMYRYIADWLLDGCLEAWQTSKQLVSCLDGDGCDAIACSLTYLALHY